MDPFLSLERLHAILAAARGLRVGVVGDSTLDGCWYADMNAPAPSREAQLFPRPVVKERYAGGGAANVAKNLAVLGLAEVRAITIIGADWRGDLLLQAMHEARVDPRGILVEPGWSTPFCGKILLLTDEAEQEDARLDFVNTVELSVQGELAMLAQIEASLPELDALVIVDFQPSGVITPRLLAALNRLAGQAGRTIFTVDSRERIGAFHNMVRKPNEAEAARWLFPASAPGIVRLDEFAEVALYPQVDCGCPLFITLGEQGCLVIDSGESHLVPAVTVPPPVDLAGAGDSFLAALTAALGAGASAVEAARLGHLAAAVSVRQLGRKGSAAGEEILALAGALYDQDPRD